MNFLNNKKSLLGVVLLTLVDVLFETDMISQGVHAWMLPVAQGVFGIGLIDKARKFTEKK